MPRTDIVTSQKLKTDPEDRYTVENVSEHESEIDLVELLYHWVRHIRFILLFAVLGGMIAAAYTIFFVTPVYTATSKLYVLNSGDSALNLSDLQIGTYLASDYIEVFKTWEVHEMVIDDLGLPYSYSEMQSMLTVENPTDTRILYITVKSPSAKEAADIANEYATVAIKYIAATMSTEEPNIMSVALKPANPASPSKTRNSLLGLLLGLLVAIGWTTLKFVKDDKVKSVDDIRRYTNLPVLAVVPKLSENNASEKQKSKRKQK